MKKIMIISTKILLTIMFFIMIFYTFNNSFVYARDPDQFLVNEEGVVPSKEDEDKLTGEFNPNFWLPVKSSGSEDTTLLEVSRKIIGPVQIIGSLISVIAIILIGIKYMLGSVEEKAQYKETLVPYILGGVLVFGIFTILPLIYNIAIKIGT